MIAKINENVTKSEATLNVARYVKIYDNSSVNILEAGFNNF
jgi:hypothetical protein